MAEKISEIILYLLAGFVIISALILTLIFIVAAIIQNIVGVFGVHKDSESDKSSEKSSPKIIYFLSATVLTIPVVFKYFLIWGGEFPWQKKFLKLFCTHLQVL